MDEGAAEQRNEQPVTPCGVEPEHAMPRIAARPLELPYRHAGQQQPDGREEDGGIPGPGHQGQAHALTPPIEKPWTLSLSTNTMHTAPRMMAHTPAAACR